MVATRSASFIPEVRARNSSPISHFPISARSRETVRDAAGEPVPFAPVYAVNQKHTHSAAIAQTDAQGFYRVDKIEVGQILVKARSGDFIGFNSGFVTVGNSPLTIDIQVSEPKGAVEGHIYLDVDGVDLPIAEAFVGVLSDQAFESLATQMSYGIEYTQGTRTAFDGSYRIDDIPARFANLLIYHPNYGLVTRPLTIVENEIVTKDHYFTTSDFEGGSVSGVVRMPWVFPLPESG